MILPHSSILVLGTLLLLSVCTSTAIGSYESISAQSPDNGNQLLHQ